MPEDTINSYTIRSGGNFTVDSTKGEMKQIPTSYRFGNDISQGEIDNSIRRVQELQKVEHVKINHNFNVDGTSQTCVGGTWCDVGSQSLHTGQAQKAAAATNKELYALIANYPDRNDGEPLWKPFPDLEQCMDEAKQITAEMNPIELPTIKTPSDILKWGQVYVSGLIEQEMLNKKLQLQIAAKIALEKRDRQIKEQKEYLVNKFGEEMYISLFKAKVEAGAIYKKEINDYTITTEDIQKAAFSDGKTERRNAFAAKIG